MPGTGRCFWSTGLLGLRTASSLHLGREQAKEDRYSGGPAKILSDALVLILAARGKGTAQLFSARDGTGIMQVPAEGGIPALLTTASGHNDTHAFPFFLRTGGILFILRVGRVRYFLR